ncbi:MAG: Aspartate/alanine antiporter [Verrucomicrobiae bacterium]|nr:Aspartate/alanine antiporter [Verrucomicrobiae bacterium]
MSQLLHEGYFAVFLIVAVGILLGNLQFRGLSLDVSAVIFAALVFGHFGVTVPADFQKIGLVLFIYTVGLQAGPGFFESFRKYGRQLIVLTIIMVGTGAVLTVVLARSLDIDAKLGVGLFAGALTSTPGLAAAIESAKSPLASIGYGVAYPFGVIGVILFVRLLPRVLRVNLRQSETDYHRETRADFPEMSNQNFVVENANIAGKTIGQVGIGTMTGATISRVMHAGSAITPTKDTPLQLGDLIKAVGTAKALENVRLLVGPVTDRDIPLAQGHEVRWILVTRKEAVGRSLAELNLWALYGATVTRIRRSGIDIAPTGSSVLRFGDKLMVAGRQESMEQVAKILGNDNKRLSETDFLPIALGIVLGVVLGKLTLPVSSFQLSLGMTGGVLVVGLLLSRLGKTGPIIWSMSGYANTLLRELGLLFFLASVGTEAGAHLVETLAGSGLKLFAVGAVLTLLPMIVGAIVGHYFFRINFLTLLGVTTGAMTSTPGLVAVTPLTESNAPAVGYATVYPAALVCMIIFSQIIARL